MSVAVTEPKSEPVGPAFISNRSSACSSTLLDLARLVCRGRLVARAVRLTLLELGDARRRGLFRQPSRQQEVPGVAPGDVDDVSAQTDVLDVLEEDELHRRYWRSPT